MKNHPFDAQIFIKNQEAIMKSKQDLFDLLNRINQKSYSAYKTLKGGYDFGNYKLFLDHIQGDPFAAPSRVRLEIPAKTAGFPEEFYAQDATKTALCDHLLRLFGKEIQKISYRAKGSGKSGMITVSHTGQQILKRTACTMNAGALTIRFNIGFPANGRTICASELQKIFDLDLPPCIEKSFYYQNLNASSLEQVIELANDQTSLRKQMAEKNLIAFIANGSILPRETGVSDLPLKQAQPFQSPESLEVTFTLPHFGEIKGMGIPKGITLIVGGGYHGKSTLLQGLELAVYPHIAGDGREYCATESSAVKLRAEDGRCIHKTDISMFISNLPTKQKTNCFSTEDASGSTSQAADLIEAMEAGSSLFLMDEDTSATNFMVRDELMQEVISSDQEPITPFLLRARELYEIYGISTILVAGSSGSFFHISDIILQMKHFKPYNITKRAKEVARSYPLPLKQAPTCAPPNCHRIFQPNKKLLSHDHIKIKNLTSSSFCLDRDTVELRFVEQLVDPEQTTALAYLLLYAQLHSFDGKKDLKEIVDQLQTLIEQKGLETIADTSYIKSDFAMPRRQEIFACFNRYRGL